MSSEQDKLRSMHYQTAGDHWLRQQNFSHAYNRYKAAVTAAGDRADARFRLGLGLALIGQYDSAVAQIKAGLTLDPTWPQTGQRLTNGLVAAGVHADREAARVGCVDDGVERRVVIVEQARMHGTVGMHPAALLQREPPRHARGCAQQAAEQRGELCDRIAQREAHRAMHAAVEK